MSSSTFLHPGVALTVLVIVAGASAHFLELNITVPREYKVQGTDAYVCSVTELPSKPTKLVGVVPLAEQSVVHHILLYGACETVKLPFPHGSNLLWRSMDSFCGCHSHYPAWRCPSSVVAGCTMPAHMPKAGGEAWECMHHSVCDGPQEIMYVCAVSVMHSVHVIVHIVLRMVAPVLLQIRLGPQCTPP